MDTHETIHNILAMKATLAARTESYPPCRYADLAHLQPATLALVERMHEAECRGKEPIRGRTKVVPDC